MATLDPDKLHAHRARTFNLPPFEALGSPARALDFVNERGFVYFWPIKGIDFPSLWTAVAGDRPVPNEHDDPGHVTWGWKDNALDKRIWYYAKVLRRKATIISLETAPYFYALTENYGDYREDYLIPYEDGRLPQGAKQVYEAILDNGPLHTLDLRRLARMSNARDSEFNKALEILQEAGLDRAALFITAAVKCRPPANRDPRPDELTVCREAWLLPQLALLAPAPVVLLGRAPARSLLGHTGNLADVRGRVVRWRGRALLATVHPTAAMRFPKMRAALEEDFRTLKALLGP